MGHPSFWIDCAGLQDAEIVGLVNLLRSDSPSIQDLQIRGVREWLAALGGRTTRLFSESAKQILEEGLKFIIPFVLGRISVVLNQHRRKKEEELEPGFLVDGDGHVIVRFEKKKKHIP